MQQRKDGQKQEADANTEEFLVSAYVSIQSGTACTRQMQPYAHTRLHIAAGQRSAQKRFIPHPPSPHPAPLNLRGWEGT